MMKKNKFLFILLSVIFILPVSAQQIPPVKAWNPEKMANVKNNIRRSEFRSAYDALLEEADKELRKKDTYTVMNKKMMPPSGDKHDYLSLGPYWWPNPDTPDGLPYIRKDGERNPETNDLDARVKSRMINSVVTLALGWYFSNNYDYADKAVEVLDTWFLDPKTKMNPNLNFAQFIPGRKDGRGAGIIDTYGFVNLVDAIELLYSSKSLSNKQYNGLKEWFGEFVIWLQESDNGKDENRAKNNHGLAYDVQLTALAIFADKKDVYEKVLKEFPEKRLFAQIEPDGRQPEELTRTLSYSYTRFNLIHMMDMAELGQRVGIDIINAKSPDGRSIGKALEYASSYIGKQNEWQYEQLKDWDKMEAEVAWLLRRMSVLTNDKSYEEQRLKDNVNSNTDREVLLYSL